MWNPVKTSLNNSAMPEDDSSVDVIVDGEFRETDVFYEDGCFYRLILDHDGDYSHKEKIDGVTHWMEIPELPGETE